LNPVVLDNFERNEFEMTYHLDCAGLLSDFHEDIEFRFSLGLSSLARRLLGPQGSQRLAGYTKVTHCASSFTSHLSSVCFAHVIRHSCVDCFLSMRMLFAVDRMLIGKNQTF